VFHHILQHGLQPHLAFMPIPHYAFATAAKRAAADSPTSASPSSTAPGTVAYRDIRLHCGADAVPLGFFSTSRQQLHLNPSEGSRLEPGDALVVLTKTAGKCCFDC
jgi:hypothetical protein